MATLHRASCGGSCLACARRIGVGHLLVHINLAIAKIVLGVAAGSKAVAVCAMYSLRDCISASMVLLDARTGYRGGARSASDVRLPVLLAAGMSLLILVGVAVLCASTMHSLLYHSQRPPMLMAVWVSLASAVICWVMARQASCAAAGTDIPTLETHVSYARDHALMALGVAGAVMIARQGPVIVDTLVSLLEAVSVIWYAGRILRRSVDGLLDASVDAAQLARIEAAVGEVEGVDVQTLTATRAGQQTSVSLAIGLPGGERFVVAEQLRGAIHRAVQRSVPQATDVLVAVRATAAPASRHDVSGPERAAER